MEAVMLVFLMVGLLARLMLGLIVGTAVLVVKLLAAIGRGLLGVVTRDTRPAWSV
jgi:hypothetical protein